VVVGVSLCDYLRRKTKVEKLAVFVLILILCNFPELMRCHMRIECRKLGGLQTDQTIGALVYIYLRK
jgi:hypothetical protein